MGVFIALDLFRQYLAFRCTKHECFHPTYKVNRSTMGIVPTTVHAIFAYDWSYRAKVSVVKGKRGLVTVRTPATGPKVSITQRILPRVMAHLSWRSVISIAASASWIAFSVSNISALQSVVGGAGAPLSTGGTSIEAERGPEAGAVVASEGSTVCWTVGGAVAPSVGRLIVAARGSASKATVKRSAASLPAPLLRTTVTSACGKLNWPNEQRFHEVSHRFQQGYLCK